MRILPLVLILVFLLSPSDGFAQTDPQASDSSFEARVDSAWAAIRTHHQSGEHEEADSVQRAYAAEFFQYYRVHPRTPSGQDAVRSAFTMWGNVGADAEAEEALAHIDYDSGVWAEILHGASNAFARSDRHDAFVGLLREIEPELTHPKSRSVLLRQLGRYYFEKGDTTQARPYFQHVIELDADPFLVGRAKGMLYEMDSLRVGARAPDFSVETLRGKPLRLSEMHGQVVLLEFWATTCGPCLPEIPNLKALYEQYGDDDFQLIGISQDRSLEDLKSFLEERAMNWPQIREDVHFEGKTLVMDEASRQYNVDRIPRTFLIDRSGTIVAKDLRGEALQEAVHDLMRLEQ